LVLRCFACNGKFTLRRLALDRLLAVPLLTPCPHCAARPRIAARPHEASQLHKIFDLREEKQSAYRKTDDGDAWHFNPSCSQWPLAGYVELEILPSVGQFCNECKARHAESGHFSLTPTAAQRGLQEKSLFHGGTVMPATGQGRR
jgi:hypothetical protein